MVAELESIRSRDLDRLDRASHAQAGHIQVQAVGSLARHESHGHGDRADTESHERVVDHDEQLRG